MLIWRKGGGILRLPRIDPPRSIPEWSLVLIVIVALSATAIVAYAAPPNRWDSLTYHMARVAHWAQAGSLGHYATGIERQNLMAPGAEIGMLHAYVLAQGDRLVNFPEWLAMVASVIGAAALAGRLGASRGPDARGGFRRHLAEGNRPGNLALIASRRRLPCWT